MCNRAKCSNPLLLQEISFDGVTVCSLQCGQIFLVPADRIETEFYDRGGAIDNCDQCDKWLINERVYDNGHILRCSRCGRKYRIRLLEFVHVSGSPACH